MKKRVYLVFFVMSFTLVFSQNPEEKAVSSALQALQDSQFTQAEQLSKQILEKNPDHAQALLIQALLIYKKTMHQFFQDAMLLADGFQREQGLNYQYYVFALEKTEAGLAETETLLEKASRDPKVSLELCLADWKVDWNHNGRLDEQDALLFQIEQDGDGKELPEGDPRRRPTFRFDHGDVFWARAMVSFQRAAFQFLLAFRPVEAQDLQPFIYGGAPLTIRLVHPERIFRMQELFLAGLDYSDESRKAYLSETDDDREWLPNPRQKDHPMPLPMDEALYQTWEGVIKDLRELATGKKGLSLAELFHMAGEKDGPQGLIDFSKMFEKPTHIVISLAMVEKISSKNPKIREEGLKEFFGAAYTAQISASDILSKLKRMHQEVEMGTESLERKLRYLFWVN